MSKLVLLFLLLEISVLFLLVLFVGQNRRGKEGTGKDIRFSILIIHKHCLALQFMFVMGNVLKRDMA